jgi:hypothetical protein
VEVSLGTRRSQTLSDVPETAWRSQVVWYGLLSPGLGVSAAAGKGETEEPWRHLPDAQGGITCARPATAAGRAAGVVDCRLACGPNFESNGGLNSKAGRF